MSSEYPTGSDLGRVTVSLKKFCVQKFFVLIGKDPTTSRWVPSRLQIQTTPRVNFTFSLPFPLPIFPFCNPLSSTTKCIMTRWMQLALFAISAFPFFAQAQGIFWTIHPCLALLMLNDIGRRSKRGGSRWMCCRAYRGLQHAISCWIAFHYSRDERSR